MITRSDIEAMSKAERLMAMDLIWSMLSESDKEVPSPSWHGDVIATRMEKIRTGQANFLSIEQLKKRLNKQASRERS